MLTPFRQRKFAKLFDLYDANHDGYIDAADYARMGEGIATGSGCAPGSADYEQMRANYLEYWEQLRQAADADQDGKVTPEEFMAFYETLPTMRETVAGIAQTMLQLTDRDGDGKIARAEFAVSLQAISVDAPAAAGAFAHLDRDGDGFIDNDELLQNVEEFFFGEDPNAPGTLLLGPL
jgi:Ca2+-binding EF-hand superfamily protein